MNLIMREVRHKPLQTSKEVFESAGVPDVPKSTRYRILRRIGKCGRPEVPDALKDIHKRKKLEGAKIT